jgi:putative ABC transport system substrate-binding protein
MMRRRDFIAGLGSAAAWPQATRAQTTGRVRRIGVLLAYSEGDSVAQAEFSSLVQGLAELGWIDGRNMRIEARWAGGNLERMRMFAKELVDLQPDVILAQNTPVVAALQRETRTIPIVFVIVVDPVGSGFVASLPRPGGNITGFINIEGTMAGKWLELLTEIAPNVRRVAAMWNPDTAPYVISYYLPSFEDTARSLKLEPVSTPVRNEAEIETTITSLGQTSGGGLVVLPDGYMVVHRKSIILAAARSKLPTVYAGRGYARDGGLLSYGPVEQDDFRRSASYVDRILQGAKPSELPVQAPVKFELVLNTKTAKALDLAVPPSILVRADEVIE